MCAVFAGSLIGYLAAPSLFGQFGVGVMITAVGAATFAMGILGLALFARR
jgi:hypothetical protein